LSPTNLLEFGFQTKEEKFHEAQKPLELMECLIKLTTKEHQIVLDPFIGSGTTAVAAKKLNRKFVGFEIDSNYVKIGNERLNEVTAQKSFKPKPSVQGAISLFG
jgi:site-specific DNA-methyltransferase (adenine-specific)